MTIATVILISGNRISLPCRRQEFNISSDFIKSVNARSPSFVCDYFFSNRAKKRQSVLLCQSITTTEDKKFDYFTS